MEQRLKIMTLNLHTYQELNAKEFNSLDDFFKAYEKINEKIAKEISDRSIDIICLQEAAQHKDMPVIMGTGDVAIRKYNVIFELRRILKEKYNLDYNFVWDWSHYGWNVWEEGVGILTRFNIKEAESRYVSTETTTKDIYSRKVLKGTISLPEKTLEVYSAHLNWLEKGFKEDIDNLFSWISESSEHNFILAGDFNNAAGSTGYHYFMNKNVKGTRVIDADFRANPHNFSRPTIRGDVFNSTQRIDYIIIGERKDVKVIKSDCIFSTDEERVSDHMAIIVEIEV